MSYPRVQFVSAPSLDADVRFDCNAVGDWSDDDRWPAHDGFSLGFPSLSGDPEAIGVQYGTREIEFNLIVRATPDAAFRAFSQLSREVQRPRNWLMVQFSEFSTPVWFYTYRTEQQALDFENVSGVDDNKRNVWGIGVRLAADPFAQGERITLPAVTIGNRIASTNPYCMTLPPVVGDAPAPVRLRIETSTDWSDHTPMISSLATDGGTYDGSPVFVSLATATAGTDAGTWTASSIWPTGGFLPITFATSTALVARVTDTTTVLPIGTYRVFVYVSKGATPTYRLRGRHSRGGASAVGDPTDLPTSSAATGLKAWVDLGLFTFPLGASMDDQDATYNQTASFIVDAQRLSGSGDLNLGAIAYVPVETPWSTEASMFFADFPAVGLSATNRSAEWDEDGRYRLLVTSALPALSLYDAATPKPTGGLPMVVPGCTNTLTLLQQTDVSAPSSPTFDNRDAPAETATVTVSYAPRYLHLAGSEAL